MYNTDINMITICRAGAQEENLFRRTDLSRHLVSERSLNECYPIRNTGALFSPHVVVFRGSEATGYPFLDERFVISVLSSAAEEKPRLTKKNGIPILCPDDERLMERKINTIFNMLDHFNITSVVLSALGYAYKLPVLSLYTMIAKSNITNYN